MDKIPQFPEFAPVSIDLVPELKEILSDLKTEISEFTAAGLYLFGKIHQYKVARWNDAIFIIGKGYDGKPYAFPPLGAGGAGASLEASIVLCEHLSGSLAGGGAEPELFPVSGAMVEAVYLNSRANGLWTCMADRDQADYVYSVEELASLPGKSHHKRRNRLNKFLDSINNNYTYEEFDDRHAEGCLETADSWCGIRCSIERPSTYVETVAAKTAVLNRDELGLRGGVILLDGKIKAFCLGEELNPETFVMHFEKSDPELDGLAALINRDFCLNSLKGYKFVNREQDLGEPGLRQAKESYRPVFLTEKFRVRRKSD